MIGLANEDIYAGQLVVMYGHQSGQPNHAVWQKADNSAGAPAPGNMIGIALSTASSGSNFLVLLRGFVSSSSYFNNFQSTGLDRGAPVYMGATGTVDGVRPTNSGEFVRIVGYQVTADFPGIRFWPSDEWYQI